jgi:hypothetical protein
MALKKRVPASVGEKLTRSEGVLAPASTAKLLDTASDELEGLREDPPRMRKVWDEAGAAGAAAAASGAAAGGAPPMLPETAAGEAAAVLEAQAEAQALQAARVAQEGGDPGPGPSSG